MRNLGTNVYSNSFEPQVNGALDARTKIEGPASDLLLKATWQSTDGNVWSYPGMIVSVYNDPDDTKNGLYQLQKEDYTQQANWKFIGSNAGSQYELPTASTTVKGGIKVGAGLVMNGEVLSTTGGGVADAVDWSNVQNKPSFATVATSGSYNDLSNKPTIPAAVTVDSAMSTTSTNPVQNKVINAALATKQSVGDYATKSEIPTKLPNPNALTFTGGATSTYDGSSAVTVNIPEGSSRPMITLSYQDILPALADPSATTSDEIKEMFGEENLKRMFTNGDLDVLITDMYTVGDNSQLYTTRNMLSTISTDPFMQIAGIELVGISDTGLDELVFTTDGTQYSVEISNTINYDLNLDKTSDNGIANSTVALALEQMERKWQYIKTEDLFSLNRAANVNLIADDVATLKSLYYPLYLSYAGMIDKKSVRALVSINNGINGGNYPYLGESFTLSCIIDGIPINVVVSYVNDSTMTAKIPQVYNPENPNVKYLTTPDLFSRSRNSSSYILLNTSDQVIINSLFDGNYAKVQLYYVGSPNGDYGICPVNIYGNVFDNPSSEGSDGENIYLTILQDLGVPVYEVISMDYNDNLFYAIQDNATISNNLFAYITNYSTNTGYIKFNNGTLLQWGSGMTTASQSYNVSLPISFLSTSYFVVGTVKLGTGDASLYTFSTNANKTESSFGASIIKYSTGTLSFTSQQYNYIAIGRWK